MDVLFICASLYFIKWEGGLGEGGQNILPDGRLADDGKRFEAMDVVQGLLLGEKFFFIENREGVWGRVGKKSDRIGPWRMTGSALKRWTLYRHCFSERSFFSIFFLSKMGRGLGKGGQKIGPDGRLADFFFICFCFFFVCVFRGGPVSVFFAFVGVLGSLWGELLEVFLKSTRFSRKGW